MLCWLILTELCLLLCSFWIVRRPDEMSPTNLKICHTFWDRVALKDTLKRAALCLRDARFLYQDHVPLNMRRSQSRTNDERIQRPPSLSR